MASYMIFAAVVQVLSMQTVYSQCINRVIPNVQNLPIEAYLPIEGLLPNQVLISQPGPLALPGVPNCAQFQVMPTLAAAEPVTYTPTIIQDSSVANNLANALQLLVVSNLLSSTLPGGYEPGYYADPYVPVGPVGPVGPIGPYNYIY